MDQRVAIIKEIRAKLGCGLREAADLYESYGGGWRERVKQILESGVQYTSPLGQTRNAIRAYYLALDRGEPEEQSMRKAFADIQSVLGMSPPKGTVCRHCQSALYLVDNQWHTVGNLILPQYCWVDDPVHGSQLHEPKP